MNETSASNIASGRRVVWVNNADRDTARIILHCLATLILCFWAAIHLNILADSDLDSRIFFRRLKWTFIAIALPELTLSIATEQFFQAWLIQDVTPERSFTPAFFATSGGFLIQEPGDMPSILLGIPMETLTKCSARARRLDNLLPTFPP